MKITLLIDNPKSWYFPYAQELCTTLVRMGHDAGITHDPSAITGGDCSFFLSCEKIIEKEIRKRNTHNIVIHSSDLPAGKGWSPLTWQILEGKNDIVNTLFEAVDAVDAGDVYFQEIVHFEGYELLSELHAKQAESIHRLVVRFVQEYKSVSGRKQTGIESFYPRRGARDSELDSHKTIADQFNLLRIVDNERYPAFFHFRGKKYILKIEKANET